MREIWDIKKRWFGRKVKRRLWLFEVLVWTVMRYGEVLRKEREAKESTGKIQKIGSGNRVENARVYDKGKIEVG